MSSSKHANPDFTQIALQGTEAGAALDAQAWERRFRVETGRTPDEMFFHTMEQIDVAPLYTEADNCGLPHLAYDMPGLPPFLRGPYPTMYVTGNVQCSYYGDRQYFYRRIWL